MATLEQRREALKAATDQIADLAAIDPKVLARTSDLSPDINFKEAVPHFEEMLDLCKQLSQRDLSRLTVSQLNAITGGCTKLSSLIQRVKDFTLNQNTPGDVCKNIITAVDNAYDEVMNPLLLPLAFTATQATDYAKIEREAKGYHATMKAEAEGLSAFIAGARKEAESALAAVKEQAAEASRQGRDPVAGSASGVLGSPHWIRRSRKGLSDNQSSCRSTWQDSAEGK